MTPCKSDTNRETVARKLATLSLLVLSLLVNPSPFLCLSLTTPRLSDLDSEAQLLILGVALPVCAILGGAIAVLGAVLSRARSCKTTGFIIAGLDLIAAVVGTVIFLSKL